jgi:hypothetical protein
VPRGLKEGTVIVTGGATLIGQAVVRAFHEQGANLAVADIDAEGGRTLAAELGERVLFSVTDIRDDAQIEVFVAEVVERFGGVDFLVNLACCYVDEGCGVRKPVHHAASAYSWMSSRFVTRPKTRPGSILPSRTSGRNSSMYARAGAGPPPMLTLSKKVVSVVGIAPAGEARRGRLSRPDGRRRER